MPDEKKKSVANEMGDPGVALGEYIASKIPKASPETQLNVQLALAKVKNQAEQFAAPKAFWMKQNIPGMDYASHQIENATRAPKDMGEMDDAPEPGIRQPVQIEREFGADEAAKQAYIERVRAAMKNASGAGK